jgi:D-sedoheptulose 7-phosphate isomerase
MTVAQGPPPDVREQAGAALADRSRALAEACRAMAERFGRGGRLLVLGSGAAAADAQHVAVEFVHPVIVGKKALPAMCLTASVAAGIGGLSEQVRLFGAPDDLVLGLERGGPDVELRRALREARSMGLLTVLLTGEAVGPRAPGGALADHLIPAGTDDPLVAKEMQVTTFHLLWELVHVFLEHPAVLVP